MNVRARHAVACALLGAAGHTRAVIGPAPAPPQTAFVQRLGEALPLTATFADADGRTLRLGDDFRDGRPVVLVLGYHRCPNLCGLVMHGVLEALATSGLPRSAYRIVAASIDPAETPADAHARRQVDLDYAAWLARGHPPGPPLDLQRLVGSSDAVEALARSAGFAHARDAAASAQASSPYVHPAGIVVVTPSGRVARYLTGVRFDAGVLRAALSDAAAERIGERADLLLLLCAHFDPATGRYGGVVMSALRVLGIALALGLAGYAWRHRQSATVTPP